MTENMFSKFPIYAIGETRKRL